MVNLNKTNQLCNPLGAICVLPASIVIWVGKLSDFALSQESQEVLGKLSKLLLRVDFDACFLF